MIRFTVSNGTRQHFVTPSLLKKTGSVLSRYERAGLMSVSLILTGDRLIRRLNKIHLHHDRITDVLAFLLEADPEREGEVYVNLAQAKRQAAQFNVSFRNEVTRLIVHGLLHLMGYDDGRTIDREKMFRLQEKYVQLIDRNKSAA